ncbi:hypothetical protein [Microbacterium sp. CIAB417]|uniref:hypothetical protein n=1 Tax=Microbacterium sp. CIAB417 TaxID=2860287 RepID=UPI001FABA7AF|nr:hypothetical protein [Microbacterium sp. CIAB417]
MRRKERDGQVKLAKGDVDHLTEDAVVLKNGTVLPADLVVYATGYGSMNGWAADRFRRRLEFGSVPGTHRGRG